MGTSEPGHRVLTTMRNGNRLFLMCPAPPLPTDSLSLVGRLPADQGQRPVPAKRYVTDIPCIELYIHLRSQ